MESTSLFVRAQRGRRPRALSDPGSRLEHVKTLENRFAESAGVAPDEPHLGHEMRLHRRALAAFVHRSKGGSSTGRIVRADLSGIHSPLTGRPTQEKGPAAVLERSVRRFF